MKTLTRRFIVWLVHRCEYSINLIDSSDNRVTKRFCPFWDDEFNDEDGTNNFRPPWYRPFNILLHCYCSGHDESMHDHPRWSITILLAGKAIEHTPWGSRTLTPGSIVIRSRKYIHAIEIPKEFHCKTWTLFIVGRRNHLQNYYQVNNFDRKY